MYRIMYASVFISPKYVFIILNIFLFVYILLLYTTITRLFGFLAEPVRDLTPCVDLWLDTYEYTVCVWVCENRDEKPYPSFVRRLSLILLLLLSFYRRTHVRSDQKHTRQHGADRALPAWTTGRDILHAGRPLPEEHAV